MTMSRLLRSVAAVMTLSLVTVACSGSAPTTVDSTITPLSFNTQTFEGTLAVQGTGFYSFVVQQQGPTSLTLAAVQSPGGAALSTVVGIGVGIPSGTGCARFLSQSSAPGLSAQVTTTLNPGTYCAAVFDVGNLTAAVNFAMRIKHP